jgi:hypothetical protein
MLRRLPRLCQKVRSLWSSSGSAARRRSYRPFLDALESRCLPATIGLTLSSTLNAVAGTSYTNSVSASNGNGTYTFSVDGPLPSQTVDGLTFSATANTLTFSGTPAIAGSFSFPVSVADTATPADTGSQSYTLNVFGLAPEATGLARGVVNQPYHQEITALDGIGSFMFTYPTTVDGLTLSQSQQNSLLLSGTPTAAGTFAVPVSVTDSASPANMVTQNYQLDVAATPLLLCASAPSVGANISQSLAPAMVNQAYTQTFQASGGSGTLYSFSSVSLGTQNYFNGLKFTQSGANLTLSGQPTSPGTYTYSIYAADSYNDVSPVEQYTLTVCPASSALTLCANGMVNVNGDLYPNVNNPTTPVVNNLPTGTTNAYYSQTFTAFGGSGSSPAYTFTPSTSPPPGLAFSQNGPNYTLSGTPTSAGSFSFSVTVTDNNSGTFVTDQYQVAINPAGPLTLTRTLLQPGTQGMLYEQQLDDNAASTGGFATEYVPFELLAAGGSGSGYVFSATGVPAGMRFSSIGVLAGRTSLTGDFTLDVTVTDSDGDAASMSYPLTILPALPDTSGTSYTPTQILQAYGINQISFSGGTIPGNGAGVTVAVLEDGDDTAMASSIPAFTSSASGQTTYADSDLATFNTIEDLPQFASQVGTGAPVFLKLDETGGTNYPTALSAADASEWAHDVDTIHSLAPLANIIVLEAPYDTPDNTQLQTAFSFPSMVNNPQLQALLQKLPPVSVVSVSYEFDEYQSETSQDSSYLSTNPNEPVTVVSSAGDEGDFGPYLNGAYYASASPYVVGAAMTQLTTDSAGNYLGEVGVANAGGSVSLYEQQTNPQISQVTGTTQRTTPDVAFVGSVNSGMTMYYDGTLSQADGSSNSAPGWAAILAIVNQGRSLLGKQPLNGPETLSTLYQAPPGDFHQITQLDNGANVSASYNLATGLGSPVANLLVPYMAGIGPAVTASTADLDSTATTLTINGSNLSVNDTVTFTKATGAPLDVTATVTGATPTTLTVTFTDSSVLPIGTLYAIVAEPADDGVSGDVISTEPVQVATVSSAVVITANTPGDTLTLMQTPGAGTVGDITYVLGNQAPVILTGVTSFTFNGNGGHDTMIVELPTSTAGVLLSGIVAFHGIPQAPNTLTIEANGLPVQSQPGSVVGGDLQRVTYSNVTTTNLNSAGSVNTISGPDTADRPTAFTGLTAPERLVQALYLDELGRPGSLSELNGWVAVLDANSATVVAGDIAHSAEATDHLVQTWYQTFLGRTASNGEELSFVNSLLGGASEEVVLSSILSSPEFFSHAQTLVASGTTQERYVQALYQLLLGRTGGTAEVAGWVGALPQLGESGVAVNIVESQECRTDLVEGYYNGLLHRPADLTGLQNWVFSGEDALTIRIGIEASAEFFTNG